jgi:hypothetical protein
MNDSPMIIQLMNMLKSQDQRYLYILGRHTYYTFEHLKRRPNPNIF